MRRWPIIGFVLVSSVVACKASSKDPVPLAYGPVRIKAECSADGTLGAFSISSWAARLPNAHAAYRFFNDGNVDVVIAPQNPNFPFGGRKLASSHGSYVDGKPDVGTPADTYKYSITISCPVSGAPPKTNIIDPDMIIPWRIE